VTTIDLKLQPSPATASVTVPRGASRSWGPWVRLLLAMLARTVLGTLLGLLLWAAGPALIGWTPTTVMTGSMEPRISPGDIIVAKPVAESSIHKGQVLLFDDPDHADHLRLHRYLDNGTGTSIVTKGDANPEADSTPIERSAVVGVGFLRVPYLGTPFVWAAGHQYGHLIVAGSVLLLLLAASRLDRDLLREAKEARFGTDRTGGLRSVASDIATRASSVGTRRALRRRERRLARLRASAGALGLLVVASGLALTLVAGGGAQAAYSAPTSNPGSNYSAGASYDCLKETYSGETSFGFPYNELSGTTTTDGSSFARVGTLTSGASFVAGSCAVNDSPSLLLDGATGQVTTAVNLGGQPSFTIETWFKTTTTRGGALASFTTNQTGTATSADRTLFMTNTGRLAFGVRPNSMSVKTLTTPAAYNDGAWHHVVATLSSSTGTVVYVDGAAVATDSTSRTAPTAAGYWRVGYGPLSGFTGAPTSAFFAGQVDNSTIYNNSAQTAAAVQARFTAGH
jgi:signal peptidase I